MVFSPRLMAAMVVGRHWKLVSTFILCSQAQRIAIFRRFGTSLKANRARSHAVSTGGWNRVAGLPGALIFSLILPGALPFGLKLPGAIIIWHKLPGALTFC